MADETIDILGKGWRFPIRQVARPDRPPIPAPEIEASEEERKIREAIWIILATAPGERVMRPDFGCGIHRLVFAVNDAATIAEAVESVRAALIRWEPRIDVLDVDAATSVRGEVLHLNVRYCVRTTNNFFNLVYPFYLAENFT